MNIISLFFVFFTTTTVVTTDIIFTAKTVIIKIVSNIPSPLMSFNYTRKLNKKQLTKQMFDKNFTKIGSKS